MKETMIATLGVEPQVVTIALDCLIAQQHHVDEVIVIYTEDPKVLDALRIIEREFASGSYPNIELNALKVKNGSGPVRDFYTQQDLDALMRIFYKEVRRVREQQKIVHLCLAGGRKVMSLLGMVVAQLLFGVNDKVWYLVTEGWKPGSPRTLHVENEDNVWLLPVPVIRWEEARTLIKQVAEITDTSEIPGWFNKLKRENQQRRKREFLIHWLTPAERKVAELVSKGLSNGEIATSLHKREQTVANQLSEIYGKLEEWLGFPDTKVDRSKLMAEFSPYFAQTEANFNEDS